MRDETIVKAMNDSRKEFDQIHDKIRLIKKRQFLEYLMIFLLFLVIVLSII